MYIYPQQQQQQQESYSSYGPPPPLPSPYPSVQSYIPPSEAALYASGDGGNMPFSQYGNGDNIAGAGAGGAEKSQYYGHNSAVSVGQGHSYQCGTDNLQRPNLILPFHAPHNGSGAGSNTSYGASGETGSTGANPWALGQQAQLGQQNYMMGDSATNRWGNPISTIVSTTASVTGVPASATIPYEPGAFMTATPRPASYHQAPSSNAFASVQYPNPWSSSMAVPYGHPSDNPSMHHKPPPLPPRPPSALNYHTDTSTVQTSSPIQRKPVSWASADDGGHVQSPSVTSVIESHGMNTTTATPSTGKAALPSLPPRYSIGLQQMVPLPPPPPLPPSQYHQKQQQQQQQQYQQSQQYQQQHAPIPPPMLTDAIIRLHQQNPQVPQQPYSASPNHSQQPIRPQYPTNRHPMQPSTTYSEGSYPQQQPTLHHPTPEYTHNQPVQQNATPIQSVASTAPGTTATATRYSTHQEKSSLNLLSRQHTDHYASSISSSILYDSTPPPQRRAIQPPPLPPPPPPQEISQMQAVRHGNIAYQQGYERANVNLSSVTSSVAAGETKNDTAAAASFIIPVTTGTSMETSANPGISSVSQPFVAQEQQQLNDVKANQTITEVGNYSTTFSADANPSDRRLVSPVNSLNKVTSSNEVSAVTATTAPSSIQLAESPKSYAAELGLFASVTGGLSGWGLYDDDDSMGNLSATTIKPGSSSALATKRAESRNINEETEGREAKGHSEILEDRVAELPHHPMPTRNESGGAIQQQLRRRTTESSVVSAISMPEGSSSSPVPSRPLLIGRPSTPTSLRDGLGYAGDKTSASQNEQQSKEESAKLLLSTSPDSPTRQKQSQAESSTIGSVTTLSGDDAESRGTEFRSNKHKEGQAANESEALIVFSEPLLGASAGNEEDPNTNRDRINHEALNTSAVVKGTGRSKTDTSPNMQKSTSETTQRIESQRTPSKTSPEPTKPEGIARRIIYADGLDSRSRASLHRCIGMLHEESDAASTDEKVKIFIDFITVEAFIRGIDLSDKLLPMQLIKEDDGKVAKEPSAGPTSFNTTTAPDMAPVNNDIVKDGSHEDRLSPILGSKDSFEDLSQGYSPGGRPIIQKPPRPERAVPKLGIPVISQMISRRATALPESEEKIFVEHEHWVGNQGNHVHRHIDRNSSTRKRAATANVLTPIIGDITKQNSSGSDYNGNSDTAAGVESGTSTAATGFATSAARSDVSSNTAIMTPPGSDADEGINVNEKKQMQQYQQQGQNMSSCSAPSESTYESYTPLKSRLSMSPDTSVLSAAAASTGRKRESIPLYKVNEQEMSSVIGTAAASRRVGMSDEKRLSKALSIVEPPIRMNVIENNSGDSNGGRCGDRESASASINTSGTATDSSSGKILKKCSLPSLDALSTLLPRKISVRRTPSPILQNIWDEISSYPSLAASSISLACTPLTGGREIIKENEFSWISDLYAAYNSQSTQIRVRLDIERQQRTEVAEQRTEQLFNDNEIGYADIGLKEEEFRKEETENLARECREDYARFTAEVFEPVYGKLQNEIGRLLWLAEYVRVMFLTGRKDTTVDAAGAVITYELTLGLEVLETEDSHGNASTNASAVTTTDDTVIDSAQTSSRIMEPCTPSLDEALCLFFCIHDKIEGRQEQLVQAITDRDERYKKSELEPLSYNSCVDYSKIGSNGAANTGVHGQRGFADANIINDPDTAISTKKNINASSKSSQQRQQVGQSKKMKQPQNPRLHSLEQHFTSAAHSAALRAAQDRYARLMSILNNLSHSGSSTENIIHRALEIAVADTRRLTDAVRSIGEEVLAASAASRNGEDGKGITIEEEGTEASKNEIGTGSLELRQGKDESEEEHDGNGKEASIQSQSIGIVGDGNAKGKNETDYGNMAALKQIDDNDDDGDGDVEGIEIIRLIKRAYQAISILKDDSAQISSVMTMFRRNLLHASHLVKICEGVVSKRVDHSEAEQMALGEKGTDNDIVTVESNQLINGGVEGEGYRSEQKKLKKMEELKAEAGKILGEVENLNLNLNLNLNPNSNPNLGM